ncbi:hypothetical protein PBI_THONKO_97 [Mycobacterium phage Thonko]|uniref:Uncharacterized protein n=1 Tax=Mycobacterium phage Thonko TaxID=2282910 RepID=A0A346FCE2_9CAUD|nr:hypothetical protein I5G57_gp097 [Mycobacterium phage Thonko]AXN53367.1 hypothetical protein PBI_THONKO_97 [Mycobacterium phage Thonko]
MTFAKWLDTLVDEKGLDREVRFTKFGPQGTENSIALGNVLDAIKTAPKTEQAAIKSTLVRIDFRNGDVLHFFDHLAGALAFDI